MSDPTIDPKYDPCRRHIEVARQNGSDWDSLNNLGLTSDVLDNWFQLQEKTSFWPSLGGTAVERMKRWQEIVAAKRAAEEASLEATRPLVIVGLEETEGIKLPLSERTAWQLYRSHLIAQDWKSGAVDSIETSSLKILRHMRRTTEGRGPVKGLVVGHVQSGKTASMAGLISMAADNHWNLFIVLSGTIENLRLQTRNRLYRDLNHVGNLSWKAIEHPSSSSPNGARAQDMQWQSHDRHLIVSLKNASRLEALIAWIKGDTLRLKQMKIVVIDDEADQAGINTADVTAEERTRINELIVELVNLSVESVNYVAYTATPAANFLNEKPGSSLYPEDFIVCLPQSDEHFGPVQIFGLPEGGKAALGIVRDVSDEDVAAVSALYDGAADDLPGSLQEALLWFLCCAAAQRHADFRKPVSMLIHTSARQAHHAEVERAVRKFLSECNSDKEKFLKRCNVVWAARSADLTQADFAERFPRYGRLENVSDYPPFDSIRSALAELVSMASAIRLDDSNVRTYHRGVHVCVDNCANNGITEENEVRRLFYPEADSTTKLDFATAFIVIGGGTLSRGLTIENLVSTFFLRGSAQADSLMQMGRWFGYRKGYELLPRIWMPRETREKFEFMTLAEEDLRDDLQRFMYAGAKPSEFGPRVLVHPRASWLKPTAKNRMQSNVPADYDFSGANRQTTIFHDGQDAETIHKHNLVHAEAFLRTAGEGKRARIGTALVWSGVTVGHIADFLRNFRFHPKAQFFGEIAQFVKWLSENAERAGYKTWNVVVAGNTPENARAWELPGGRVGLINRSRVVSDRSDGAVSIGALRDPVDLLADANLDRKEVAGNLSNSMVDDLRKRGGVGGTPQLLLYLIDRNSEASREPRGEHSNRADLRAKADIVGVSLWMPGSRARSQKTFVSHLTVRIPQELADHGLGQFEVGANPV